jgi:hypothetical protein
MKCYLKYVLALIGLLSVSLYPANAESMINAWTGFVAEGNKAYAIEENSGKNYLVQYEFPNLNPTGKELLLSEQFNYSIANSFGLLVYDYTEEVKDNEISEGFIEVTITPTLNVKSYNLELSLIASKTIPLPSYSYTYPKFDTKEGKRKAKKLKAKILQNTLDARKL